MMQLKVTRENISICRKLLDETGGTGHLHGSLEMTLCFKWNNCRNRCSYIKLSALPPAEVYFQAWEDYFQVYGESQRDV